MIRKIRMHLRTVGLGGLLCSMMGGVTHSAVALKVSRKHCKHPLWLRVPSSDVPTYKKIFVDQEYDFLMAPPPKAIIDAGANIGLASIYFANKYPDAKVVAIEPEQSNFELLQKNVAPYSNIVPLQAALWNANEEINLIDPGLGKWGFMTATKDAPENLKGDTRHTVRAMTVDRVMSEFKLDKIDVLKVDIEGAEREVFRDTSAWIGKVDSIIIELHEHMKAGCNRSFYEGSKGFDHEWMHGENMFLSRGNCLTKRPA